MSRVRDRWISFFKSTQSLWYVLLMGPQECEYWELRLDTDFLAQRLHFGLCQRSRIVRPCHSREATRTKIVRRRTTWYQPGWLHGFVTLGFSRFSGEFYSIAAFSIAALMPFVSQDLIRTNPPTKSQRATATGTPAVS